jgi:hypothetical protein
MKVHLASSSSERVASMAPKDFGKLLHAARMSGWQPEMLTGPWPSQTWSTKILLPHIGPYLLGPVSSSDAVGLCTALRKVAAAPEPCVRGPLYLDLLVLIEISGQGKFVVRLEADENGAAA